MDIQTIEKRMQEGGLTPHELASWKAYLAGIYSYHSGMLEQVLVRKPMIWNEIRKNVASDKAAERAYEGTQDGVDEMKIRLMLKRLDKLSAAISSLLRVLENEARLIQ